jgi:hypothetical protein
VALLAPARDAETQHLFPSIAPEVFAVALLALVLGRAGRILLAAIVAVAALFNAADVAAPLLLGRDIELWWDLRHLPSLWGMARDAMGFWRVASGLAVGVLLLALLVALLAVLLRPPRRRVVLAGAMAAATATAALLLPARLSIAVGEQAAVAWRAWEAESGRENAWTAAMRAPLPPYSDLAALEGRDVHLVFVESYGSAARGRVDLAPLDAALRQAGFSAVSHRLLSPTYGGGSWLAHATLASGLRVSDQLLYRLLLRSDRPTLPRLMREAGYRTVQVMPGIKKPYPEAAFWGFDRIWDAAALAYRGPPFGWFEAPDQATVRRVLEAERDGPLFVEWVLVSSHVPFAPVPPLVAWEDAGAYRTVDEATWKRVYAQPDWNRLDGPYIESLDYVFRVLAEMLAQLPRDAVLVILGDHQPPAFVLPGDDWSVPVHILARDERLLAPFRGLGYAPGVVPHTAVAPRPMEAFLADFLRAMDRTKPAAAR